MRRKGCGRASRAQIGPFPERIRDTPEHGVVSRPTCMARVSRSYSGFLFGVPIPSDFGGPSDEGALRDVDFAELREDRRWCRRTGSLRLRTMAIRAAIRCLAQAMIRYRVRPASFSAPSSALSLSRLEALLRSGALPTSARSRICNSMKAPNVIVASTANGPMVAYRRLP